MKQPLRALFVALSAAALLFGVAHAQYLPLSGGTMTGTLIAPYPDVISSSSANIGGLSGSTLSSTYGLNNSGRMLAGWNLSGGGGETDLIINRGAGGTGGLTIYDIANSTYTLTKLFGVDGSGNVSVTAGLKGGGTTWFSGDGFPTYWEATTGAQGLFTAEGTGTNAIVGAVLTNSTAGDDAQGGTFIAYGSSNNTSSASVAVGMEGETISLSGYGGTILSQIDATNGSGHTAAINNPWTGFGAMSAAALELSTGAVNTSTFSPHGLTIGTVNNISSFLVLAGCTGTGVYACANSGRTTQAYSGIQIEGAALDVSCGTPVATHCGTGTGGVALDMPSFAEFRWMDNATTTSFETWGSIYGWAMQNATALCALSPQTSSLSTYCSSDRRMKHAIEDAGPALPYLDSFHIRQYVENASNKTIAHGVIAQEVQANHPELVRAQSDGMLAVAQPSLWALVKAIQELNAKVDSQAVEIADLKRQNAALRSTLH